jgi:hypothetical protein
LFETTKQTEIFCFWFHEKNRNTTKTDLVSVCFGSNRKSFLFVSRTPYLHYLEANSDICASWLQSYTVIRCVWGSVKFGTCTVVSVNGTLVEDKMCTPLIYAIIFNKCIKIKLLDTLEERKDYMFNVFTLLTSAAEHFADFAEISQHV